MKNRTILQFIFAQFLFLSACMPAATATPTVDSIATDVSRAQAVAATLTAAAPTLPSATTIPPFPGGPSPLPTIPPFPVSPVPLPTILPFPVSPSPLPTIIIPLARTPSPPDAMIINHHTQLCLTVQGRDVVQATCGGSDNQMWGYTSGYDPRPFVTKSGACLSFSDIDIVVSGAGCPIWTVRQWGDYLSIKAQNKPHPGPPHPNPVVLEFGIYFQIIDGGNCVDVDGWNHDEGGRLINWPCNGSIKDNANELWAYYRK